MVRIPQFGDFLHPIAEVQGDHGRDDEAEDQHPLEDARAFAALPGTEAFGEVEWDDYADQAAAHALQQATQHQA